MRKLAPARVSCRDDFLISYRVNMMTGSFHTSLFEGTLHIDKIHVWFLRVIQQRKHYACAKRSCLPADRFHTETGERFAFTWYRCEISYQTVKTRNTRLTQRNNKGKRTFYSLGVFTWRRGDSRRNDILWWYHVNKYRALRGNRSELAPGRKSPRCHVNTPRE